MWTIATIEVFFYSLNEVIVVSILGCVDIGGALVIHMFGAYFGLACTYFFQPKKAKIDVAGQNGGSYYSNLFAMIGTYFLFLYWPSFNGAIGKGSQALRAIINTVLSITSSTISALMITRIFKDERHTVNGKQVVHNVLDVEILLNSTLAGGVAMGAAADIIVKPYYAMVSGWVTGVVSALGYIFLSPFLKEKFNLHDTCGIHNLHAMPGFIGGIISVIACNQQSFISYGPRYG